MDKKRYDSWMKQFDETVAEMRNDFSNQLLYDSDVQGVKYTCEFNALDLPNLIPALVVKETTKAIVVKED